MTATSMESFQRQQQPVEQPSSPARRPRFPGEALIERPGKAAKRGSSGFSKLMDSQSKFIDPAKEALLVTPEQTTLSNPIALESQFLQKYTESTVVAKKSVLDSAYEYLLAIFEVFKKSFRGSRRHRARLTRKGEEALSQLQYLAALCDATSCRTPDEIITAESAFGEAYYEIMRLSCELEKMSQPEQHHHVRKYHHHVASFLRNAEV